MHPAPSIIVFSTLSGAGYGLLFLLGAGVLLELLAAASWLVAVGTVVALLLVTIGLVSSTGHLTHPERAWRAISQWRSSWLSREGVAALLTYLPAVALVVLAVLGPERATLGVRIAGGLAALGAALTVWCTGMIYASLKPVRSWHQPLTPWLYVVHALMGGLLLLHPILLVASVDAAVAGWFALLMLAAVAGVELVWRRRLGESGGPTVGSATGLGALGRVRMVEPPHTQTNYLLDEMGYRIGRKHARKLRRIALGLLVLAGLLTALALAAGAVFATVAATLAVLAGLAASAVGRWLFFAEARHTVTLYYGRESA